MENALLMSFMNSGANLLENVHHPIKRQPILFGQHVAERAAIQIFHHQIRDAIGAAAGKAKVSNIDDIRMTQASGGASRSRDPLIRVVACISWLKIDACSG